MPMRGVHDLAFSTSCLENTLKLWCELPCDFHLSYLWLSLFYQVRVSAAVKWLAIYNPVLHIAASLLLLVFVGKA